MRKRVNISIDLETLKIMDELVDQRHTNRSQYIIDMVWDDYLSRTKIEKKFLVNQGGS